MRKNLSNISRQRRLLPLLFFEMYLTLSVLLFAFGPWPWSVSNPFTLYLYLVGAQIALGIGYLTGAWQKPRIYAIKTSPASLIIISAATSVLLLFPTSALRTGSVVPNVVAGLLSPGNAYAGSADAIRTGGIPFIEYARIFFGPILGLVLPLAVFYWKSLLPAIRGLAIIAILGNIALFISMGTNRAIADFVISLPWLLAASAFAGRIKLNWPRFLVAAVVAVLMLGGFFSFFTASLTSRTGSSIYGGYVPQKVDSQNLLLRILPDGLILTAIGLDSYLTNGYYGLSLDLQEPFVPMYGVGNSMFLTRETALLLGNDNVNELSYPVRVERDYGWSSTKVWSTIYPWIASDVSFPGSILIIFLIGKLLATSWINTISGNSPFSVVLFSQMAIMLYYFPANNQLAQAGENLTGFLGAFALWYLTSGPALKEE